MPKTIAQPEVSQLTKNSQFNFRIFIMYLLLAIRAIKHFFFGGCAIFIPNFSYQLVAIDSVELLTLAHLFTDERFIKVIESFLGCENDQ